MVSEQSQIKMNLSDLTTEARNPATAHIDEQSTRDILRLINQEDHKVAPAVGDMIPQIEQAVELVVESLLRGGRLFYIGAGTSGRLGVVDAAECPPTFGTDPELVQGLIAGGAPAIFCAQENAEDQEEFGARDLQERNLQSHDVVVGLTASGRTPYVIGGLKYAQSIGCAAIGISCNRDAEFAPCVKVLIAPQVGPEVLTGSTRMKAGTAEKLILNMISTTAMIRMGKVEGNLLVEMQTRCHKLRDRARRVVMEISGASSEEAESALAATSGNIREAIEMAGRTGG